jgi:hypothetical protein
MSDRSVLGKIEQLVEEERDLLDSGEGKGPDADRDQRLERVKVELDRCWDLLRQRRAQEEFGRDPDQASARDAGTVEGYQQ